MSQFDYESPDQSAAANELGRDLRNGLSRGERWGQYLRGVGWAVLTLFALFASCAISILLVWMIYKLGRFFAVRSI